MKHNWGGMVGALVSLPIVWFMWSNHWSLVNNEWSGLIVGLICLLLGSAVQIALEIFLDI